MFLVEKINQASRCCHQHVATFLQRGYLVLVASATCDNDGSLTSGCANAFGNVVNLGCKLSRRRDNERTRIRVALGVTAFGVAFCSGVLSSRVALLVVGLLDLVVFLDSNTLQRRQHKRCSFTCSCLSRCNNILTCQDGRNCRCLYGGGRAKPKRCNACQNLLV